ncbi:hypothetical protein B0H11DRAFT_2282462 [Mycena galericulata]|nr:hypothetical protein B0H11DRAFT_2282462 [Mycena galericulata]
MVCNLEALTLAAIALLVTPSLGQLNQFCWTAQGGTVGNCSSFISTFCTSIAGEVIPVGGSTARCFPAPTAANANLQCDFTARNAGTVDDNINIVTCETQLTAIAAQCAEGGGGQPSGQAFQFWGDPNTNDEAPETGVCERAHGN